MRYTTPHHAHKPYTSRHAKCKHNSNNKSGEHYLPPFSAQQALLLLATPKPAKSALLHILHLRLHQPLLLLLFLLQPLRPMLPNLRLDILILLLPLLPQSPYRQR